MSEDKDLAKAVHHAAHILTTKINDAVEHGLKVEIKIVNAFGAAGFVIPDVSVSRTTDF